MSIKKYFPFGIIELWFLFTLQELYFYSFYTLFSVELDLIQFTFHDILSDNYFILYVMSRGEMALTWTK